MFSSVLFVMLRSDVHLRHHESVQNTGHLSQTELSTCIVVPIFAAVILSLVHKIYKGGTCIISLFYFFILAL